jgi:aldose 1-epimerase
VLTPDALLCELSVVNRAPHDAPLGLGWHPYFPKRQRSRLQAGLQGRWEADATRLPTRRVAMQGLDADIAQLHFDNCFDGWSGRADIRDERLALTLSSSLRYLVIYTPQDQGFFAVEPVSHVNNAINQAEPAALGLQTLAPGASLSAWMKLEIPPAP